MQVTVVASQLRPSAGIDAFSTIGTVYCKEEGHRRIRSRSAPHLSNGDRDKIPNLLVASVSNRHARKEVSKQVTSYELQGPRSRKVRKVQSRGILISVPSLGR